MASDQLLGYLGALVAVFFFGTCYVPAKQYPTYDGIIFQWFMCSGILMVGLAWGLISNNWSVYAEGGLYVFPGGILGGSLFAIANLLVPSVVNNLGLGVGFMLWNGMNITMGYLISRFGWFGVTPTIPNRPLLSELGILCMIGSIGVYGMIKPTLATKVSTLPSKYDRKSSGSSDVSLSETSLLLAGPRLEENPIGRLVGKGESLTEALMHPELPNYGPYMMPANMTEHVTLVDERAEKQRKVIGTALALVVGAILSCCLVPYVHWQQSCQPSSETLILATCNPLNFVFSQCLGIYLTSTMAFLVYSVFHRFVLKRSMPKSVMRPAYLCGVLWAIGLAGQLYSAGQLGFDQAYPLSSIGPAMVSMLWSACYFKEIQGTQNLQILAIATMMVLAGTALRVVSA